MATPRADLTEGIDPFDVLAAIVDALDGTQWDADTTEEIARVLREAGYEIRDYDLPFVTVAEEGD